MARISSHPGLDVLRDRWRALPANVQGSLWILSSAILFTAMSTLVKLLGTRLDPFVVIFFRALTGLLFVLPFMTRGMGGAFHTRRPAMHLIRGIFGTTGMMCGFYAVIYLPLATASAISFSRSLFLVPMAVIVIREALGVRRTLATVIGFCGVLIVLRPSAEVELAALVATLGALAVAGAAICVKLLSRTESPQTLLFYSSVIGLTATSIPAFLAWSWPTPMEFFGLITMGAFGVTAQTCFIKAYSVGEVSALAPLDYTRLLFAAVVGYFLFGNMPDVWTWVGALVIVGSSLYITMREAKLARSRAAERQKSQFSQSLKATALENDPGKMKKS
ncbi:MAG: DMT family transporter [Alphaproteobacteria bacterium]|nr:MAG: DMT family transporter [Alphaproteobacteria bacterium]